MQDIKKENIWLSRLISTTSRLKKAKLKLKIMKTEKKSKKKKISSN
uniref:Uncharacterized protein n=1 Tax=Rhizophora mucronata TaxID=61149 RepID=A0A2P2LPA8_RHIMU